ncbi:flagellar brake protein [Salinispira pacifica]|uniref:PilZ domain-containing protein n=1 Tax=Salinispira pacifica TaxID=1307761 RepID=V5WHJ2_9SPIO|nr:PilZ domain-containing protein [Salinispira pacifica]AHC14636.1 hypothetical protein L21SP2_1235 [Salinispira pacifica]
MNPMLLQFIAKADNTSAIISAIIFGALVLLMILSARRGGGGGGSRRSSYNKGSFKKTGKNLGLESHHIQLLQKAVKDNNIANPQRLYQSPGYLNKILQNVISDVEDANMSRGERNRVINEIFEIKRRISRGADQVKRYGHTKNLKLGQDVTVYSKTLPPAQSQVTGNLENHLAIETPVSADGSPMKYRPGATLKVRFIRDSGKVYVFLTKLREYRKVDGIDNMLVDHSDKVEQNQLRKSPRREFNRPAYFQPVEVITEGKGKKARRRAVVNKNRRFLGQIEDISRGGCALYSRNPMRKGALLKIRFDFASGEDISVFGKVRSVEPTKPFGGLMHVAFTRVSMQHLNEIQSYVYGFFEE